MSPSIDTAEPEDVSDYLGTFTRSTQIPGLAVLAVRDGGVVATGTAGVRKAGDPRPVTIADKFHIGSCTKSMTGTLAAILVSDGLIHWQATVAEVFPDSEIHPGYRAATLLQMASNSGGVPGSPPPELWRTMMINRTKPVAEERVAFIHAVLAAPPAYPPGGGRVYANGGFTIAGSMLERVSGRSYEQLLRERLFAPLQMDSAGFGCAASPDAVDQPWGHRVRNGPAEPVTPGPFADNPPAIAPAGRVHLNAFDFAKYANLHLGQLANAPLDGDSLRFLHTAVPPGDSYGIGWVIQEGGKVIWHNGSNTMNHALIWLRPEQNFGALVLCNSGAERARGIGNEVVDFLAREFLA